MSIYGERKHCTSVSLTTSQLDKIRKIKKTTGKSMSEVIRDLIDKGLKNESGNA